MAINLNFYEYNWEDYVHFQSLTKIQILDEEMHCIFVFFVDKNRVSFPLDNFTLDKMEDGFPLFSRGALNNFPRVGNTEMRARGCRRYDGPLTISNFPRRGS